MLDIPVDEDVLRSHDKQAAAAAGAGAADGGEAGPGSEMDEDASDDVSGTTACF